MKSITKLKDEARKHEQQEEWDKAIQAYLEVLKTGEEGEGEALHPLIHMRPAQWAAATIPPSRCVSSRCCGDADAAFGLAPGRARCRRDEHFIRLMRRD